MAGEIFSKLSSACVVVVNINRLLCPAWVPRPRGGSIKRLSCVAYIGPKSRTERPRKTKTGTEVAHVTRDSDTTFKINSHQAALVACSSHYLTYMDDDIVYTPPPERAAACRPWGGGISWRPPTYSLLLNVLVFFTVLL